ncbi:hypothetical protein XFLM_08340 [Xylella fastidiosa subsp. fastidiosa GB514]|nr:hypothetical protein XFLM_08340 [Xylella fastidiosa subsp. fastidiosa GB514]KAF0572365.1 hypothetical protein P305_00815 [Xylella fastidiosa subsp. fastidiosa Mus-1]
MMRMGQIFLIPMIHRKRAPADFQVQTHDYHLLLTTLKPRMA